MPPRMPGLALILPPKLVVPSVGATNQPLSSVGRFALAFTASVCGAASAAGAGADGAASVDGAAPADTGAADSSAAREIPETPTKREMKAAAIEKVFMLRSFRSCLVFFRPDDVGPPGPQQAACHAR